MATTDPLSQRELDVAELLLQGKSNKQIALALGISDHTVEFHLRNIYAKLGVSSRAEAILYLGKSTGRLFTQPGESLVVETAAPADNGNRPVLPQQAAAGSAKSIFPAKIAVLLLIGLLFLGGWPICF